MIVATALRAMVLLTSLPVAGCAPPAPTTKTEGAAQKIKMDVATKRYAECIADTAAGASVDNDAAGSIANRIVLSCRGARNTLMADVIAFHQIGHPKFSIAQSKAVAEASIATIEDELRRETVVGIVSRQIAGGSQIEAAPAEARPENFSGPAKGAS